MNSDDINNINEIDEQLIEFNNNTSLPDIETLLILGSDGIHYRDRSKPMITKKSNKGHEFWLVLKLITKLKFSSDQWFARNQYNSVNQEDIDCIGNGHMYGKCLCTKNITNYYCIQNKASGKSYCVGCCCVKKVSKQLYNEMTKQLCGYCDQPLLNKRLDIQKDGFCDSQCKHHAKFLKDPEMKTECYCGEFASVYETRKGINQGKYYYKCYKGFGYTNSCDFWKWIG